MNLNHVRGNPWKLTFFPPYVAFVSSSRVRFRHHLYVLISLMVDFEIQFNIKLFVSYLVSWCAFVCRILRHTHTHTHTHNFYCYEVNLRAGFCLLLYFP